MSEKPLAATVDETKPCRVCGEKIKKIARVCIHCNNYQDWRADLNISSTVLSLLVALFGVLTVALPAIKNFVTPNKSSLSFSFQGIYGDTIGILASNNGNRPGTVRSPIEVLIVDTAGKLRFELNLLNSDSGAYVVEPSKSILLNLRPPWGSLVFTDNDKAVLKVVEGSPIAAACTFLVTNTEFNSQPAQAPIATDCRELPGLFANIELNIKRDTNH
jgi:hypothetical protein